MRSLRLSSRGVLTGIALSFLSSVLLTVPVFSQDASPFRREIDPATLDPEFVKKWSYIPPDGIARPDADSRKRVRLVYIVPSDRSIRPEYIANIAGAFINLQEFYRTQMGSGYTFVLNNPVVEVVPTQHTAAWYNANPNGNSFWISAAVDGFTATGGTFNDPNNRWIIYIDSDNACNQPIGAASGVAVMSANDLRGLNGDSVILASCPGDPTVSPGIPRWIGGAGHELGHAFGLPHPPGCGNPGPNHGCTGGELAEHSLMWTGYASYPNTHLLSEHKQFLTNTGFFYNVVSISGRITANGRGVAGALVRIDSAAGTRYTVTNPMGYYRFFDLDWNIPYVLQATHKRFAFGQRSIMPTTNVHGYDIAAN